MTTLGDWLQNPAPLEPNKLAHLVELDLAKLDGTVSERGIRIRDNVGTDEDKAFIFAVFQSWNVKAPFEWITEDPQPRQAKVFGPASSCGDMASHSMGYE